ncbi:hypothetical protein SAMN04488104_10654 [Algoriphagus faecimaris]|uniref:Uncharacterized protein n=1 Tax=Algoriphagus faecimaris TaxID=686796 RepID=A0A1G6XT20_9BACT|nr:hypothetical protein [Algoriphagus faecimaris]SDD80575.1 hypothetical protein SAMN04488104_10654 [Algoriphagus faecimaris]
MKKGQNKETSRKAERKKASEKKPVIKAHRSVAEVKYSDGLVRIYKREEEDINRFADFARTLISK